MNKDTRVEGEHYTFSHAMNLKKSTILSYFGECSVANEALQVSCMVDCNSLWYKNLVNRKCLQGTHIVNMITSDKWLAKGYSANFAILDQSLIITLESINNLQTLLESTIRNNRLLK